jgi:hypothetical protein
VKDSSILLTQCGQAGPYQDSVYAGTVIADNEQDARAKLQAMRQVREPIFDKQDAERWSFPYFTEFRQIEPHKWKFRIVEEYTG